MSLTGTCRCEACHYALSYETVPVVYACHCLNCQTLSGSGFALQALIPASRLSFSGDTHEWTTYNAQGKATTHYLCAICKTRVYSVSEARSGMVLLRAGTLDESNRIEPSVHMWIKRKQPWITLPDAAEAYEEGIPADRIKALLAPNFV